MTSKEIGGILHNLRLIPRVLTLASAIFFGVYVWEITEWYMGLEVRTVEESGFAASVITLLGGVVKFIFDKFMDTEAKICSTDT